MKKSFSTIFVSVVLFAAGVAACERHQAAPAPLTPAACDPYCERVTACTDTTVKLMAGRRAAAAGEGGAPDQLKDKRACLANCSSQLNPDDATKYPTSYKFSQIILRGQMSCLEHQDCRAFTVCRQAQLARSIAEYPMDPTDARRCDETCNLVSQCAAELVPRVYLAEYEKMPLDQRAELVRQHGDRDRCLQSCRFASIKFRLDKRKLTTTVDDNWIDLQPFMQCLAYPECKAFTQCVISQSSAPF